tara:strand:- start:3221 stop:3622 length:402 start_codon:yes stop_codon:yes gene_type:complete
MKMKNSKVLKGTLLYLGGNLIVIGSWRLFDPISFALVNDMDLNGQVSLINEARGAAGAIVGFGILIVLGVFIKRLTYTSSIMGPVLYLGYGVARLLSCIIDGYPGEMAMVGMIGEFVVGSIGLFALMKYSEEK